MRRAAALTGGLLLFNLPPSLWAADAPASKPPPAKKAAPARPAAKAKVPIYTIAYGTENGYVDLDGKREKVPPDKALLQRIASMTNGQAYAAESAGDLDTVYKNIRSEVGYEEVRKEITATWAGYGLAFAVVAALAAVSLGARWP